MFERHLEMAEIKEAVFKVLASLTDDAIVHNQYRYFLLILAALMILFVFVYPRYVSQFNLWCLTMCIVIRGPIW